MVQWYWVNFQYWGVLQILTLVRQGPTALTVGAGGGCYYTPALKKWGYTGLHLSVVPSVLPSVLS